MLYNEFMSYHKKNPLGRLYLLAGEESYYIDKAKKFILGKLFPHGISPEDVQEMSSDTSIGDFVMTASSAPFFSDKNVIVIRDWSILGKKNTENSETMSKAKKGKKSSPEESLLAFFDDMPDFSTVILINGKQVDKRTKIGKALVNKAICLEADQLRSYDTSAIITWLRGKLKELGKTMDREAEQYFVNGISMMDKISLGFLEQEIDKLALFIGNGNKSIDKDTLSDALSDIPEVSGFAMLDAISAKDAKRALYLLQRQLDDGVYLPKIVSLLVVHVRRLSQVKLYIARGFRGKELAIKVGGPAFSQFIANKLAKESEVFSSAELKKAFLELADADYWLKTGQDPPALLESIVIKLCNKGYA